jgi:hypothetical protein
MFAAGVQVSPNTVGGDPTQHLASTTHQAPSANHESESRTHGPTQATPSDPDPAITQDTTPPRTVPNQKKPHEASVTEKTAKPDHTDEAKSPAGKFSCVDAGPATRAVRVVRACANCGVTTKVMEQGKLMECSSCRSVRYCGRACQKADWPAHKPTCKRLQTAQELTSSCLHSAREL